MIHIDKKSPLCYIIIKEVIFMNDIIDMITGLISNVGFPIACCIVLFKQNSKFNDTIAENTNALNSLVNKIERWDKSDDVK